MRQSWLSRACLDYVNTVNKHAHNTIQEPFANGECTRTIQNTYKIHQTYDYFWDFCQTPNQGTVELLQATLLQTLWRTSSIFGVKQQSRRSRQRPTERNETQPLQPPFLIGIGRRRCGLLLEGRRWNVCKFLYQNLKVKDWNILQHQTHAFPFSPRLYPKLLGPIRHSQPWRNAAHGASQSNDLTRLCLVNACNVAFPCFPQSYSSDSCFTHLPSPLNINSRCFMFTYSLISWHESHYVALTIINIYLANMLCDSSWLVWATKSFYPRSPKSFRGFTKWLSMTSSTGPSCSAASHWSTRCDPGTSRSHGISQRFSMTFNNRSWSHRVSMLIIAHPYSKTSCKGLCALILQSFTVPSKPALHTCPGHETELESHGKVGSMIRIDKGIGRREFFGSQTWLMI